MAFRDTDADIEQREGKPISEIFIDDGEASFRALEVAAVAAALAEPRRRRVAGRRCRDVGRHPRRAGRASAWSFSTSGSSQASARVGLGGTRPMLLGNVRGQLKALIDARRPLYDGVAIATVLTDDLDAEAGRRRGREGLA